MKRKSSFSQKMAMRGHYRSFKQARAYVHTLKIGSYREWLEYCKIRGKKPMDIPQNPRDTYFDKGWAGFSDWLGNDNISYRHHEWRSFPQARTFVRKLKLSSTRAWRAYVGGNVSGKPKLPRDIPTNPNYAYPKNQWKGYGDWLGNNTKKKAK